MSFIKRISALIVISILIISCGPEELTNAEKVVGYWQVREESKVLLNGVPHSEYVEKYWVNFYEDFSGQIYDIEENPTTEIIWSYQVADDYDRMIISYKLGGDNTLNLYTTEENSVSKFNENTFRLFKQNDYMIGDSSFNTNTFAYFVRQ